ncbi:hypothetical protein [Alteromonas phage JH01]|nr:hypothetical protein [Alteromonas phage JH01]
MAKRKIKKPVEVFRIAFKGDMSRHERDIFATREDAILNMVNAKDDYISNPFLEGAVSVQVEYHDLDCYIVQFNIFVEGLWRVSITLETLNLKGVLPNESL